MDYYGDYLFISYRIFTGHPMCLHRLTVQPEALVRVGISNAPDCAVNHRST